jgi:hypothetical protein
LPSANALGAGLERLLAELFQQIVVEHDRVLEPDHTASLNARGNLGVALGQQSKAARAHQVLREVVADYPACPQE